MGHVKLEGRSLFRKRLRIRRNIGFSGDKHSDKTGLESSSAFMSFVTQYTICSFSQSLIETVSHAKHGMGVTGTAKSWL